MPVSTTVVFWPRHVVLGQVTCDCCAVLRLAEMRSKDFAGLDVHVIDFFVLPIEGPGFRVLLVNEALAPVRKLAAEACQSW